MGLQSHISHSIISKGLFNYAHLETVMKGKQQKRETNHYLQRWIEMVHKKESRHHPTMFKEENFEPYIACLR
jgi:hypothetical protein